MSTGPARTSLPRFGGRAAAWACAGFLLLGLVYTAPLALHLGSALPYAAVPPEGRETAWRVQGDHLQYYYYLWLVRDRVLHAASILRDPFQFAVDGARSNLPNTFLPAALLYLPLSVPGPRLGYNLLVLLSFPAAGLATALLVRRYGLGRGPALVAGVLFACAPYRVGALLGGHPAGMAYALVPLALWGLEGALAGKAAGGLWCAAALAALAVMEPHFFYFAALGLPLYLLARVGLPAWSREQLQVGGGTATLAALVAAAPAGGMLGALGRQGWRLAPGIQLALAAVVMVGFLAVWQLLAAWLRLGGAAPAGRSAARLSLRACLPWLLAAAAVHPRGAPLALVGLGLPFPLHAALLLRTWRAWRVPAGALALAGLGAAAGGGYLLLLRTRLLAQSVSGAGRSLHEVLLFSPTPADLLIRVNPVASRAVYLGAVALALAVIGTGALARWRAPRRRVLAVFPVLLALATALSLGPRLPALPLFEAGFRLVPTWHFIRQPAKFQVLAGLALAVLAAAGVAALARGSRRSRLVVCLTCAALIAVEYHPWRPAGVSRLPTAGAAHAAIRDLGPRALYLPLWPGDSSYSALYLYATTLTRVPMLNGYSAWIGREYVSDVYRALEALNLGALGPAEHAALRRHRVRQVVLDREAFPLKVSPFGPAFTLAGLRASPYLELARPADDRDELWLFTVRERPAGGAAATGAPMSPLGVYWEAESLLRDTGQVADDPEASSGRAVIGQSGRDRPGFLAYGPYRLLPTGSFRAVFRLRGEGAFAEVQVTTEGGRRLLGARGVSLQGRRGFEEAVVWFALAAPAPVEYRVKWDGAGVAAADAVSVTFADIRDPVPSFEIETLAHELRERHDPEAEGGIAGYADPALTPRDRVWQGPLRRYPAGRYRLWVRLKLDRPTDAPLAWCGAQGASLGPLFGGRELRGAEVPAAGHYVELAIPFTLSEARILEFPCLYRGTAGIWFDRLRIEEFGGRPTS
jgi:hypothetical protein